MFFLSLLLSFGKALFIFASLVSFDLNSGPNILKKKLEKIDENLSPKILKIKNKNIIEMY